MVPTGATVGERLENEVARPVEAEIGRPEAILKKALATLGLPQIEHRGKHGNRQGRQEILPCPEAQTYRSGRLGCCPGGVALAKLRELAPTRTNRAVQSSCEGVVAMASLLVSA